MVVLRISLRRAPGCGVPVDGGATKVGDAHEVEREDTCRALGRSRGDHTGGPEFVRDVRQVESQVEKVFEYPEPDPVVEPEPDPVSEREQFATIS